MEVRIRSTGAVVFDSEFRVYAQSQGAKFGEPLTEEFINQYGGDIVFEGAQATGGTVYQYSMRQGVEQQSDGKWYSKYVLGPIFTDNAEATAAQQEAAYKAQKDAEQAASVRAARNSKLAACDWTQLADSSADKPSWATYRQALRDVTGQAGFPWNVTWPVEP